MSRHSGIGQGAVINTLGGQIDITDKFTQLVAGGIGKNTTGNQYRASDILMPITIDAFQFGIEEFTVERGIVCDQWCVADKLSQGVHYLVGGRRFAYHSVRDAGEMFDERRYPFTCIHQTLEMINNVSVFDDDDADFSHARAIVRRHPCCFEIENGDGLSAGPCFWLAIVVNAHVKSQCE